MSTAIVLMFIILLFNFLVLMALKKAMKKYCSIWFTEKEFEVIKIFTDKHSIRALNKNSFSEPVQRLSQSELDNFKLKMGIPQEEIDRFNEDLSKPFVVPKKEDMLLWKKQMLQKK